VEARPGQSKGDLCSLFERHLSEIEAALEQYAPVEIDRTAVTPLAQRNP
jgi:hypothetical protein